MNSKEIRELTIEELTEKLEAEEEAYQKLLLTHAVTPLDRPSDITNKRKVVARLKTILQERRNETN